MYENQLNELREVMEKIRSGAYSAENKGKRQQQMGIMASRASAEVEEGDPTDTFEGAFLEAMLNASEPYEPDTMIVDGGEEGVNYGGTNYTADENRHTESGQLRPRGRTEVPSGDVQNAVFQGLLDRDVPEKVAQALMLNFQDESAFNIDITESEPNVHGTRGKGLYQLTGSRRDAFESKFGNDYSIDNQLDWLVYDELQGTESNAYQKMLDAEDFREAAVVVVEDFLRPAKQHRIERANRYMNATGYAAED